MRGNYFFQNQYFAGSTTASSHFRIAIPCLVGQIQSVLVSDCENSILANLLVEEARRIESLQIIQNIPETEEVATSLVSISATCKDGLGDLVALKKKFIEFIEVLASVMPVFITTHCSERVVIRENHTVLPTQELDEAKKQLINLQRIIPVVASPSSKAVKTKGCYYLVPNLAKKETGEKQKLITLNEMSPLGASAGTATIRKACKDSLAILQKKKQVAIEEGAILAASTGSGVTPSTETVRPICPEHLVQKIDEKTEKSLEKDRLLNIAPINKSCN